MQLSTRERRLESRRFAPPVRDSRLRSVLADEIVGWCSAVALLLAFALGASGVLRPSSPTYLVLNFFGAVGLAYTSFSRHAYSPAALNIVWALIAALSLLALVSNI